MRQLVVGWKQRNVVVQEGGDRVERRGVGTLKSRPQWLEGGGC